MRSTLGLRPNAPASRARLVFRAAQIGRGVWVRPPTAIEENRRRQVVAFHGAAVKFRLRRTGVASHLTSTDIAAKVARGPTAGAVYAEKADATATDKQC